MHWNVAVESVEEKLKVGVGSLEKDEGASVMLGNGGVLSTVQDRLAGEEGLPDQSTARTSKL